MKESWSLLEEDKPPENWRTNPDILNIADIVENAVSEGPGVRFVIWLQGCPIRCEGCWNSHMWDFSPKHLVMVDKLAKYIISKKDKLEGITLVGGEPLAQAAAVRKLMDAVKEHGLTVVLYTGYNEEEIIDENAKMCFNAADIVIAGPYIKEKRNLFLRWRGSENQNLIFHNKDYEKKYGDELKENIVELHITEENGEIVMIGFPVEEIKKEVRKW